MSAKCGIMECPCEVGTGVPFATKETCEIEMGYGSNEKEIWAISRLRHEFRGEHRAHLDCKGDTRAFCAHTMS